MGLRVQETGSSVEGSGLRVEVLWFSVWCVVFRVEDLVSSVRVSSLGFGVRV